MGKVYIAIVFLMLPVIGCSQEGVDETMSSLSPAERQIVTEVQELTGVRHHGGSWVHLRNGTRIWMAMAREPSSAAKLNHIKKFDEQRSFFESISRTVADEGSPLYVVFLLHSEQPGPAITAEIQLRRSLEEENDENVAPVRRRIWDGLPTVSVSSNGSAEDVASASVQRIPHSETIPAGRYFLVAKLHSNTPAVLLTSTVEIQ